MRTRMVAAVVAVLALVSLTAQGTRGDLSGKITDTANGPLPGVKVTVSGPERRDTLTDTRGEFTFTQLLAGRYQLDADLTGFTPVKSQVRVAPGRTAQLALQMAVGALEETVAVT